MLRPSTDQHVRALDSRWTGQHMRLSGAMRPCGRAGVKRARVACQQRRTYVYAALAPGLNDDPNAGPLPVRIVDGESLCVPSLGDEPVQVPLRTSKLGATPKLAVVELRDAVATSELVKLLQSGHVVWRGHFSEGKRLLARGERLYAKQSAKQSAKKGAPATTFLDMRGMREQQAIFSARFLLHFAEGFELSGVRAAPDLTRECAFAFGSNTPPTPFLFPLKELLGVVGGYQWYRRGLPVPQLDGFPLRTHFSVFPPGPAYLQLVQAALGRLSDSGKLRGALALDVGTGSGVLAALLLRAGAERVVASDSSLRAVNCARENLASLDLLHRVDLRLADSVAACAAGLPRPVSVAVCNPPWLPGAPASVLETAVYDAENGMLCEFLRTCSVGGFLAPDADVFVVMSGLAEDVGLRPRGWLEVLFQNNGFEVVGKESKARRSAEHRHKSKSRKRDPRKAEPASVEDARANEEVTLWHLKAAVL